MARAPGSLRRDDPRTAPSGDHCAERSNAQSLTNGRQCVVIHRHSHPAQGDQGDQHPRCSAPLARSAVPGSLNATTNVR